MSQSRTPMKRTSRFSGRYNSGTINGAVNVVSQAINPLLLDSRLLAASDQFQEFRFVRLRATVLPLYNATAWFTQTAIAYTPVIGSNSPTTFQHMADFPVFAQGNGMNGTPNPHVNIPKKQLFTNAVKWFRRGTAYDDLIEIQGYIHIFQEVNYSVAPVQLLIEYDIEFAAPMDPTLTASVADQGVVKRLAQLRMESKAPPPGPAVAAGLDPALDPLFRRDGMIVVSEQDVREAERHLEKLKKSARA